MDSLFPRMSWRRGAGSDSAIQMMRRSWSATCVNRYHLCSMVVTACGDGRPCTLLPITRALAATSRIGARTISPPTPLRLLREKSLTGEPTHRERTSMVSVLRRLKDIHTLKVRRVAFAVSCFCDLIMQFFS
jgi:hypothetical protein